MCGSRSDCTLAVTSLIELTVFNVGPGGAGIHNANNYLLGNEFLDAIPNYRAGEYACVFGKYRSYELFHLLYYIWRGGMIRAGDFVAHPVGVK